ncbi:proline reductase-associated electron transfer protein PrdC [Sporohalobacter salinus]|nr:proline reductase-associated electron transfer protein PrdC [Sporohalobacter salinus]
MDVVIPLKQHIGADNNPIVKKGEKIKKGQLIAKPEELGANVHASVSGTVKEISEKFIKIKAAEDQPKQHVKIEKKDSNLEQIKEAGVVGAGGAGFPTHLKLDVDIDGGVVIANAAECEPVLTHNIKLIKEKPELIVKGLNYIKNITNASKGYIAIKPKHKEAVIALKKICMKEEDIEIRYLPNIYPVGDEKAIIRELLDIELEPGELPTKANAVVQNVETLKNIVNAIEKRKPVITKDLTVGGRVKKATSGKVFLDVPLGVKVKDYIEKCGGYIKPHGEIVLGGPFMNQSGKEDSPVTKTLGGILVGMPFPKEDRKVGILACQCGGEEDRLEEIAKNMGTEIVAKEKCKRMIEVNGSYKCEKPGVCPGQSQKVLSLKDKGAEVLLVGTCDD